MNKKILLPILSLIALVGCKTNENNYRQAYEIAQQKERAGLDSTVYDKIRQEARPLTVDVNGESVRMMTQNVSVVPSYGDASQLKRYSVVANKFHQSFNAKAMMHRLQDNGYKAFLLQTSDPVYYVVVGSFDSKEEATFLLRELEADSRIVLKEPYPYLLEAAQLSR